MVNLLGSGTPLLKPEPGRALPSALQKPAAVRGKADRSDACLMSFQRERFPAAVGRIIGIGSVRGSNLWRRGVIIVVTIKGLVGGQERNVGLPGGLQDI